MKLPEPRVIQPDIMKPFALPTSFLLVLLLAGCTSPRLERELKDRPFGTAYQPANIHAAADLPPGIRRVVVLPFHTGDLGFPFMPEVEEALVQALRRTGRFEILRLGDSEMVRLAGTPALSLARPLPPGLLEAIRDTYQADAILQTDITAFRPYKPLRLGVQSRLFTMEDQRILWSCDELFDAGNRAVAMGARHFAEREVQQPYPLQSSYSALSSPQRFAGYVGHTLFATLPPRLEQAP